MLSELFIIILAATIGQVPAEVGQVSATVGRVVIHRGGRPYAAAPGATLQAGDRVETGPEGRSGLLLDAGHALILGAETTAVLTGPETMTLARGEARITAAGAGVFAVEVNGARAEVWQGILRAASDGARFRAERGSAELKPTGRGDFRLDEGREVSLEGPRPTLVSGPGDPIGWTIRPDDLLAAGGDAGRVLLAQATAPKPGDRPATPPTIPPRPGTNPPATPPPTPPQAPEPVDPTDPNRIPRRPRPSPTDPEIPPAPDEADPTRSGIAIPLAPDDAPAALSIGNQPASEGATIRPYQPVAVSQPTSFSSISIALGSISLSSSAASSGALFSDAQQDTRNLTFPGNIHLVTGQTNYILDNVRLRATDRFPLPGFYSIGVGPSPTGQVDTGLRTGTNLTPTVIRIPKSDAYLVRLDQFGIADPATNATTGTAANSSATAVGVFGFLGADPIAPQIRGAEPLKDGRARFNDRLTFALGEFKLDQQDRRPVLSLRRSDQDRQIIKANPPNEDLDQVTPSPDVNFAQIQDAKFFPDVPLVFVPAAGTPDRPTVKAPPTFGRLDLLRKAATTTLVADSLSGYAKRTGQTRFVVDGRIIDITGYRRPPSASVDGLMRSGHATPGLAGGPGRANGRRAQAAAAAVAARRAQH